MSSSGPIVGIDLGTTNSLVGAMDAGFPVLIADADGHRLLPSVVSFEPEADLGSARFGAAVGRAALALRVEHPELTVSSIKRLMGARVGEVAVSDFGYKVGGKAGGPARVLIYGQELSPEEISSWILRALKAQAQIALGVEVNRAVITVPAYFNDAQRNATKEAGELAGLHVERILNEPTAAALAYGMDRLGEKSKIAVYDLGGGTFDISILELNAGVYEVLATTGNTRLGGDDIDAALAQYLSARIDAQRSGALAPSSAVVADAARAAKVQLTEALEAEISVRRPGVEPLGMRVTRRELEAVARPIVERTRHHCLRALADAKLTPADLNAVILVGGATRMPLVREFVAEVFGREPDTSQNPDEAVALGATIQAGILSGAVRDVVLLDVTPLSLGIETFGGLANVIIPRNTTIPTRAGEMFTNPVAGQKSMGIHVIQGERERAADNWTLGRFEIDFTPGPRGSARVGVQFEIDADGILHVLARDTKTGQEQIVEVRSAVDVSDEKVEAMIAGSVEHAFDDYRARLLVEAKLKADEMLPAVKHALGLVGDNLPEAERTHIAALATALETAAAGDDLDAVKAAVASLDEGTQTLATLLIEQATDEALVRRGVI